MISTIRNMMTFLSYCIYCYNHGANKVITFETHAHVALIFIAPLQVSREAIFELEIEFLK